jgi:hypothetical protein
MVRWTDGALRSTVDRRWHVYWARRCLTNARRASATARQSSPAVAEGDEGDEAVMWGRSREDERRRGGSAMMVKSGGGSSSA